MAMNKYLDINRFNAPIKRHKIAEWIRKHDLHICCLQDTYLRTQVIHRQKVKGGKKFSMQMDMNKKAGVAILISDKIDFRTKAITRDKEGYFIILKGVIQQERIIIVNVYTPNLVYMNI